MGYTRKLLLKKTAVPSLFKWKHRKDNRSQLQDEMEVILPYDEFSSDYSSTREEEEEEEDGEGGPRRKKKKKTMKQNHSSDEWEPATQEYTGYPENFEMSEDESESDGGLPDDSCMPVVGCEECGSEARLQCSLLRHRKFFACPKCVASDWAGTRCLDKLIVRFSDYQTFQVHAEEDHGYTTKRVLCQECGVFYLKPTEANGKKEHVCEYKTKHFVCSICKQRFQTEKGLKAHTKKLHSDTVHPCKYCLLPFQNRSEKLQHEAAHPKEDRPYDCPDCPETFRSIVKRNRHLRTHRGPLRYQCKTCGKGFPHLDRLERHELIHSGVKPFKCEVCTRSFTQEGHLRSHMRLHTGEKPYKCMLCEKCFNHNVSLKIHVLREHRATPPPIDRAQENARQKEKKQSRPKGRPKRVKDEQENGQENGESGMLSFMRYEVSGGNEISE